ncbi:MAG: hypothetical protein NZO16_07130 [Deltaproteobacteria bacterium]|nr:hypothetical protein [Deltaproteobacteria bacterium]
MSNHFEKKTENERIHKADASIDLASEFLGKTNNPKGESSATVSPNLNQQTMNASQERFFMNEL